MDSRIYIRKWIIPVIWVVVTLLASYILAKYIFPLAETEKKLFGLMKAQQISFNFRVFYWTTSISLATMFLGLALRLIKPVKDLSNWLANRIIFSPWFILALTITSGSFYILGITKELFVTKQIFFAEKEVTLLNSIRMLFDNNENFLGTIIFIFTILFPIFKYILLLFSLAFSRKQEISKLNRWMSVISKWSMLDVYIVALLLLNMKFDSRIINMELREGVVWFTLSIILIMIAMIIPRKIPPLD